MKSTDSAQPAVDTQKQPWMSNELELLKQLYGTVVDLKELVPNFPDRTLSSIKQRARKLGLVRPGRGWTLDEENLLRHLYVTEPDLNILGSHC